MALPPFLRLLSLIAALAVQGCGDATESGTRWNVVWIILDAAGAEHLSLHGYDRRTTPYVDRLGRESVVFERAFSQAPSTLYSAASYLTGRYPHIARSDEHDPPTIARILRQAGYATAGFSDNPFVGPRTGLSDGFESFWVRRSIHLKTRGSGPPGPWARSRPNRAAAKARKWLAADPPGPFFLYVHILEPHTPYDPPSVFRDIFAKDNRIEKSGGKPQRQPPSVDTSALDPFWKFFGGRPRTETNRRNLLAYARARYDENLRYADWQVREIVEFLRRAHLLDESILIVASDHGEAFGRHDLVLHASSLFEDQIHVPLLIRLPEPLGATPRRISRPVQLADVAPTLVELLPVEPRPFDGRSLLSDVQPAMGPVVRSFLRDQQALISRNWKLISTGDEIQLYDIARDPNELENVARQHPDVVVELRTQLIDLPVSGLPPNGYRIDDELRDELNALGYALDGEDPVFRQDRVVTPDD